MLSERESSHGIDFKIIDEAPVPAMFASGQTLEIEYVNKAAAALFELPAVNFRKVSIDNIQPGLLGTNELQLLLDTCVEKKLPWKSIKKQIITNKANNIPQWFVLDCRPVIEKGDAVGAMIYFISVPEPTVSVTSLESRYDYLNHFFKAAPIAIVCYRGPDFIVDVANDHALAMWGKQLSEVKGKPIEEIFPQVKTDPIIWGRHLESVERMKRGQRHVVNEVELVFLREGRRHTGWYTYIHEPYTDLNGEIIGTMAVAIEVTDQVLARERLQLITDSLPSLIAYIDDNEKYSFVNKAYETWFGGSKNTFLGKPISEALGEKAYNTLSAHIKKALSGVADTFEGWVDYTSGRKFISASYIPHLDESKNVLGYIGLVNDLTEKRNAEERLSQFNIELENQVQLRTNELSAANELLQQLIDSSIEFIAVVDNARRFTIVNAAFLQFVGRKKEELLGKRIEEIFPDAGNSLQAEQLSLAFEGQTVHLKTNPSFLKDDVWFDTYYLPLTVDDQVQGVIMMSRDITSIVKSERELSRLNRQLEEAQMLAKLGSWEWNVRTGEVTWSKEMYNIYGYDSMFPVDFNKATERMTDAEAAASRNRTQEHLVQAETQFRLTGERVFEIDPVEFGIQLPGGHHKKLRSSGQVCLTEEGSLDRIVGAVQDVTDIRNTEHQLRLAVHELENKNRELESFNYVVSHDLKEPLRKITLFTERLKRSEPNELVEYISKIDSAANRMRQLIESILSISRISNKDLEFRNIDLNVVLDNCKSDLEVSIRELNAVIQADTLPVISADEWQITQVFINLIGNALKFCEKTPLIMIGCKKVRQADIANIDAEYENYWRLEINDNGIGFDTQYADRIFQPFQRLHSNSRYTGTGIGLSIVKKVVDRHRGFIEVDSRRGEGSRFTLWLPAI